LDFGAVEVALALGLGEGGGFVDEVGEDGGGGEVGEGDTLAAFPGLEQLGAGDGDAADFGDDIRLRGGLGTPTTQGGGEGEGEEDGEAEDAAREAVGRQG
jgi:hypothetical protein